MNIFKKSFVFLIMFGAIGFFIPQKASADNCSNANPGFFCLDTGKIDGESGCKTNLCGGGNSVQCCSIENVVCRKDGSSFMQPCSADGGKCNMTGECTTSYSAGTVMPATPTTPSRPCGPTEFCNPLKFATVEGFLGGIMSAIQKIIVVLALVFITIGSVMILVSAGNSGWVEKGKSAITMALLGLAIGFAAPSLLKELAGILGWGGEVPVALTLSQIAVNVLNFLLGTMGIVALVMMVIGGIMYLTAGIDEDMVKKGKAIFKYALIGVLMAMTSMVLVTQVARFFQ